MSSLFEDIKEGLEEAIQYSQGNKGQSRTHRIPNIKNVRKKTGLNQKDFSETFGISVGTLRHWEQGTRKPTGAALALVKLIDSNPEFVIHSLQGKSKKEEEFTIEKYNPQFLRDQNGKETGILFERKNLETLIEDLSIRSFHKELRL